MIEANRDPRIALIGCGRWGKNIARVLAELGVLTVVVDHEAERLSEFVAGLGARVTDDLDQAFGSEIDAVAIAAPAVEHFRLAQRALECGKAVFVEKPLALQLADARALADLATARNLPLMVGHLLQYHPAFIRLKQMVADGAIGEVRHITSNRLNPGAIRTEENALWSMGPHDFSMVLGIMQTRPKQVEALAVRVVNPAIPDQFSVQLQFSDVVTAQVNVSWLSPYKEHKLVVLGTEGALVFEDTAVERARKLVHYPNYVDLSGATPTFAKGPGVAVAWPAIEPLHAEMSAFVAAARSGEASRSGADEAIPVLELLHRATAAAGL